jgi:pyruvate kinase
VGTELFRRVKILATIGPSSGRYEVLSRLIQEGVDGFRINFSHGEPSQWDEWIKIVRELSEEYDREVSIIGDLPGPQVRIGELPPQEVKAKDNVKLVFSGKTEEEKVIPIPIRKVFEGWGKVRTVYFSINRYLDGTITIWSSKKIVVTCAGGLDYKFKGEYDSAKQLINHFKKEIKK